MEPQDAERIRAIASELRQPLTSLGLQVQHLRRDVNGGGTGKSIDILERNLQRFTNLVDEMERLMGPAGPRAEGLSPLPRPAPQPPSEDRWLPPA